MYKLQISITKEILKRSMYCGVYSDTINKESYSCAIALAIKDFIPNVQVGTTGVYVGFGGELISQLPIEARDFIKKFDSFRPVYYERLSLPEFSFEIEIPDTIISKINIEDAFKKLANHENLKLIEA